MSTDAEENALHAERLLYYRADRRARRDVEAEERATIAVPMPELLTLSERLARPRERARFRIERWLPENARVVLAAQFKAGKSTAVDNLVRCLLDGDPWLDAAMTTPVAGNVVLLDFEMSAAQKEDQLADQKVRNADRLVLVTMRGAASSFNILDDGCRAEWAAELRGKGAAGYLVLDCLRPVLDALGLDENHDAGRFLVAFDALLAAAGIAEAAVVHHMGHAGERSRGDSRIRDWPDAEWRLVRQDEHPGSTRFVAAYGRDVDVPESALRFDKVTRRLSLDPTAGNRAQVKVSEDRDKLVAYVREHPGQNAGDVLAGLGWGHNNERLNRAREAAGGLIRVEPVGTARLYHPADGPPPGVAPGAQLPVAPGSPGSLAYFMSTDRPVTPHRPVG